MNINPQQQGLCVREAIFTYLHAGGSGAAGVNLSAYAFPRTLGGAQEQNGADGLLGELEGISGRLTSMADAVGLSFTTASIASGDAGSSQHMPPPSHVCGAAERRREHVPCWMLCLGPVCAFTLPESGPDSLTHGLAGAVPVRRVPAGALYEHRAVGVQLSAGACFMGSPTAGHDDTASGTDDDDVAEHDRPRPPFLGRGRPFPGCVSRHVAFRVMLALLCFICLVWGRYSALEVPDNNTVSQLVSANTHVHPLHIEHFDVPVTYVTQRQVC
ncbi:hypothetical protein CYMTET_17054 [Cymbomonas tetramitiformis]|uniref:Uncharacterized protein n=1 Tax=Cymbomonas tetramitiformis TaxID=36881 RepID=A0AAE0GB14_9CHLO|nr:hypothetical protein CYMTET_17054 [Cymbomonas tetramitiformis]